MRFRCYVLIPTTYSDKKWAEEKKWLNEEIMYIKKE